MTLTRGLCVVFLFCLLTNGTGCARKVSEAQKQAWERDIALLQAEQDSLRQRAAVLVREDARIQALPQGDVIVAVPTAFLTSVVERLFTDVVSNVTLRLSGIRAHVEQSVKKVVTLGKFVVDVEITEIIGKLKPGQPRIRFGGNGVSMTLPVEIIEGRGNAKIHFVWDGKNVADMACGDMDVTQEVSGNVIPTSFEVSGAMDLELEGNNIIAIPKFPETRVNIRVTPSKESWDAVNAILEEKRGVCGFVLDKVKVPELLSNLVEKKGFNVKLPLGNIKPIAIPAGARSTVEVKERNLAVAVTTKTLRVDPDALWYSADVTVGSASPDTIDIERQ